MDPSLLRNQPLSSKALGKSYALLSLSFDALDFTRTSGFASRYLAKS